MVVNKHYRRTEIIKHFGLGIVKIRVSCVELHNDIGQNITI